MRGSFPAHAQARASLRIFWKGGSSWRRQQLSFARHPIPPKIRWSSLNWSNIQVLSANNSQRECREASVEEQNHQVWTIECVYVYIYILYYIILDYTSEQEHRQCSQLQKGVVESQLPYA